LKLAQRDQYAWVSANIFLHGNSEPDELRNATGPTSRHCWRSCRCWRPRAAPGLRLCKGYPCRACTGCSGTSWTLEWEFVVPGTLQANVDQVGHHQDPEKLNELNEGDDLRKTCICDGLSGRFPNLSVGNPPEPWAW